MIKQIQLRGISRTPSDRATEDGGCAESLNFHIADGESVPTLPPRDVTPEGLAESGLKVIYIHKGTGYANYIGELAGGLYAWTGNGLEEIRERIADIVSITSNGNILVVALSGENATSAYAIFRDGHYTDLGDGAPIPTVSFSITPQQDKVSPALVPLGDYPSLMTLARSSGATAKVLWDTILANRSITGEYAQCYASVMETIWGGVESQIVADRGENIFCAPVLARYAVRLYDGSYIYNSEPILLSGSESHLFMESPQMELVGASGQSGDYRALFFNVTLQNRFKVNVHVNFGREAENWDDLIESVDIFLSEDIRIPGMRANFTSAVETSDSFVVQPSSLVSVIGGAAYLNYEGLEHRAYENNVEIYRIDTVKDAFEKSFLQKANFYRSIVMAMSTLPDDQPVKPSSQDDLVVQSRLPEGDSSRVSASGVLSSYNNRILSGAQTVILPRGHSEPHCVIGGAIGTMLYFTVIYHVRDASGVEHIVQGYRQKGYAGVEVRGYIAYPDPRCFQADIYYGENVNALDHMVTLPMKEHPRLNCSYGFWGLNSVLWEATDGRETGDASEMPDFFTETFVIDNRLALSETDNPFSYPLAQRVTFQSEIIAALPITIPLSAYQFGHHDIFVFTKDGIWTVSLNDEGGAASSHPFSRDVAFPGTPAQLDQAIAFVSEQGVMILTEGGATNISPNMNGRHYVLDTSVADVIAESEWASLLSAADSAPFMAFARECEIAYDYAGRRILLFNRSRDYQYVYMFDSQTWHKISGALPQFRILNSYPDCLVSTYDSEDEAAILDFSTVLDDADLLSDETNPVLGMIVTRAQDLGAPDVRKVVRDIRIRGHFNRGDVKYMMLGSFDGKTWKRLLSKGGGSYNLFRFVILAKLSPTERISWIDVDCETRFANKLR